jgi:hypothetical protein
MPRYFLSEWIYCGGETKSFLRGVACSISGQNPDTDGKVELKSERVKI